MPPAPFPTGRACQRGAPLGPGDVRILLTGEVLRWLLGRATVALPDGTRFRPDPAAVLEALADHGTMALAANDPRPLLPGLEWVRGYRAVEQLRSDPGGGRPGAGRILPEPTAYLRAAGPAGGGATPRPAPAAPAEWLLYDAEGWGFTGEDEQRNPARAFAEFCALARSAGARPLCAPALTLAERPASTPQRSPSPWQYHLDAGWPEVIGGVSDGYVVQAQRLQRLGRVNEFSRFVEQAATRARAAAASSGRCLLVLAGLSTAGGPGSSVRLGDLLEATERTAGLVDGYWLNVPRRGPACPNCPPAPSVDLALALLTRLGRSDAP